MKHVIGIILVLLVVGSSYGADLSIDTEFYSTGGLFTNPLFPAEHNSVTITVRAIVEGQIAGDIKAKVAIKTPGGEVINQMIALKLDKKGTTATGWKLNRKRRDSYFDTSKRTATGSFEWKTAPK